MPDFPGRQSNARFIFILTIIFTVLFPIGIFCADDSTGSISGRVTRDIDGIGLPFMLVNVFDSDWNLVIGTFSIDESANYTISGLPAGSYYLQAYEPDQIDYIDEYYDDAPTRSSAKAITVITDHTTAGINFSIASRGSISGSVRRKSDGAPISGVMHIYDSNWNFVKTTSIVSGAYYTRLLTGWYYLKTENQQGCPDVYYNNAVSKAAATAIEVTPNRGAGPINFTLEPSGGNITGWITQAFGGEGISDGYIEVYDSKWNYVSRISLNSGHYTISNLLPGSYYLKAVASPNYIDKYYNDATSPDSAATVTVKEGQTTAGIDFHLTGTGSIAGRVLRASDGTGIAGVVVKAYYSGSEKTSATTDALGNFLISGLAPNRSYSLRTSNQLGFIDSQLNNVRVAANSTSIDNTISLVTGGNIQGRVTLTVDGTGYADHTVKLYDSKWKELLSARTDSAGYYGFYGLVSGNYYVGSSSGSTLIMDEYYNGVTDRASATLLEVTAGNTLSGIDLALSQYGSISGRVTRSSDGMGLSGVSVRFYRNRNDSSSYVSTTTDPYGYYSYNGSGVFYVGTSNTMGYGDQFYSGKPFLSAADKLVVDYDTTITNLDFSLPAPGAVSGKITRDSDGTGISGVTVVVFEPGQNSSSKYSVTNASGNYTISGLTPGNYLIMAGGASYISEFYDNASWNKSAVPVAVKSGATTAGINFRLTKGSTITGRITRSSDNTGISGLNVAAFNASWRSAGSTTTNTNGEYSISGLRPGSYYIGTSNYMSAYASEYYPGAGSISEAARIAVAAESTVSGIDLQLDAGRIISGRIVRASDGTGIANVSVTAKNIADMFAMVPAVHATSDSQGYYRLKTLAPGRYLVYASSDNYVKQYSRNAGSPADATPVEVLSSADTANIDFALESGGAISGAISGYSGIESYTVIAFDENWEPIGSYTGNSSLYSIRSLPAGDYFVRFASGSAALVFDQYYGNSPTRKGATSISVASGQVTANINFTVDFTGVISGKAADKSSGTPISGILIKAYDEAWQLAATATTDESGRYRLTGLAPGKYYAGYNDKAYADQYSEQADSRSRAACLLVSPGMHADNINFSLSATADMASISGKITSRLDGANMPYITVNIYNSNWEIIKTAPTDPYGNYSITGIPSGSYYIRTSALQFEDLYYNGSTGSRTPNGAATITVGAKTNLTGINFSLDSGLSLQGSIYRLSDGNVLPGIYVEAYDESGTLASYDRTDAHGMYSIEGLKAGKYYLKTRNTLGYTDEFYQNAAAQETAAPVTLMDDGLHAVAFHLSGGGSISGQAVRKRGGATLAGIKVIAYIADQTQSGFAVTGDDGSYRIDGLMPGSYILKTSNASGWLDQYYEGSEDESSATAIHLTAGENAVHKNFHLNNTDNPVDFNGDGQEDLLQRNIATGEIRIQLMNGITIANDAFLARMDDKTWKIAGFGDFNGDGKSDIVWRNMTTGANAVWYINGTTSSGDDYLPAVEDLNWVIAGIGNFNGDVKPDILWRNMATGENYIGFMNGAQNIGGSYLDPVGELNWKIAGVGRFNADTKPDILWRNISTGENYVWFMNGATRTGGASLDSVADKNWNIVAVGDYDCNDRADIVWRNAATGESFIWYMNGTTRTGGEYLATAVNLNWLIMDKGDGAHPASGDPGADFNGDKQTDVLWRNTSTGANYVWYMDGTTMIGGDYLPQVPDQNWKIAGTGDFNNDGKVDLLWRNMSTGVNAVWFMHGVAFLDSAFLPPVDGPNWKIAGTGDFNKDGKVDIVWRNMATGDNAVWFMDGATFMESAYLMPVADSNWKIAGTGDFNNDGSVDIAWRNTATGENAVWLMNGTTFLGSEYLMQIADLNWKIAGTGDFNKDSSTDILWRNAASGINAVWFMDGVIFSDAGYLDPVPDAAWTIAGTSE